MATIPGPEIPNRLPGINPSVGYTPTQPQDTKNLAQIGRGGQSLSQVGGSMLQGVYEGYLRKEAEAKDIRSRALSIEGQLGAQDFLHRDILRRKNADEIETVIPDTLAGFDKIKRDIVSKHKPDQEVAEAFSRRFDETVAALLPGVIAYKYAKQDENAIATFNAEADSGKKLALDNRTSPMMLDMGFKQFVTGRSQAYAKQNIPPAEANSRLAKDVEGFHRDMVSAAMVDNPDWARRYLEGVKDEVDPVYYSEAGDVLEKRSVLNAAVPAIRELVAAGASYKEITDKIKMPEDQEIQKMITQEIRGQVELRDYGRARVTQERNELAKEMVEARVRERMQNPATLPSAEYIRFMDSLPLDEKRKWTTLEQQWLSGSEQLNGKAIAKYDNMLLSPNQAAFFAVDFNSPEVISEIGSVEEAARYRKKQVELRYKAVSAAKFPAVEQAANEAVNRYSQLQFGSVFSKLTGENARNAARLRTAFIRKYEEGVALKPELANDSEVFDKIESQLLDEEWDKGFFSWGKRVFEYEVGEQLPSAPESRPAWVPEHAFYGTGKLRDADGNLQPIKGWWHISTIKGQKKAYFHHAFGVFEVDGSDEIESISNILPPPGIRIPGTDARAQLAPFIHPGWTPIL